MKKYFLPLVLLFFLSFSEAPIDAMDLSGEDEEITRGNLHSPQHFNREPQDEDNNDDDGNQPPPARAYKLGKKTFRKALAELILGNSEPMQLFIQAAGRRVLSRLSS